MCENKSNILILGGSGYLGRNLIKKIDSNLVDATYNNNAFDGGIKFDATNESISQLPVNIKKCSHAVILLGETNPDTCLKKANISEDINVSSIKNILEELYANKITPVFASTEAVFDGEIGDYKESDATNPLMLYAKQKYEIEKNIRNKFSKYIILRISKVYGYEENNGNILYSWFQQITRGDSNIKCASDFISSPVLVDDVSELILKLIKNNHHGVYHVGGPHAMSRFDMFNALLNEVKKYVNIDVRSEKCSIDDFQTLEPRPKKINLNTDKLSNLFEYKLHTIEEVCKKFVEDNCGAIKG